MDLDWLASKLYIAPPIFFSLTVHEFAHAWMAQRLGDPTARFLGRLTLNPLAHLDFMGTAMLFLAGFGWAKPVPVDVRNLSRPRRDMLWIAAAGPVVNVVGCLVFGGLYQAMAWTNTGRVFAPMIHATAGINAMLAVFNLLPLAPLDGSRVLVGLLPPQQAARVEAWERQGAMILVVIVMAGMLGFPILWAVIGPPISWLTHLATGV